MAVTIRISGKKGKITLEPKKGVSAADLIYEAAEILGLTDFELSSSTVLVDGATVAPDTEITGDVAIDVAPNARLG